MKTVQVGKMLIDAEGASNLGVIMAGTVSVVDTHTYSILHTPSPFRKES